MKKSIFLIVFFMFVSSLMAQNYQKVVITYDRIGDGLYNFYAENPNFYPMQICLDFPDFQNMTATCPLPYVSTLEHGKHYLFQVKRVLYVLKASFSTNDGSMSGTSPFAKSTIPILILIIALYSLL